MVGVGVRPQDLGMDLRIASGCLGGIYLQFAIANTTIRDLSVPFAFHVCEVPPSALVTIQDLVEIERAFIAPFGGSDVVRCPLCRCWLSCETLATSVLHIAICL